MAKNTVILGAAVGIVVIVFSLISYNRNQMQPAQAVQSAQTPLDQAGLKRCLEAAKKQYDAEIADWSRKFDGQTPRPGLVDPFKRALTYYEGKKHHCHNFYG